MSLVDPDPIGREVGAPSGPLSLAFACPGWPPAAFANGIISLVAAFTEQMRRDGHAVTVLSDRGVAGPGEDVRVIHDLRRSAHFAGRIADRLVRRASPWHADRRQFVRSYHVAIRRLIAERGVQLLEMEEVNGYVRGVRRGLRIPVALRLYGPWFLNAMDVPADEGFRRRVESEGWAIRDAFAISSPSLDVLSKTREFYGLELPQARVIPNAVAAVPEVLRWSADAADAEEILFVGRFDRHKGGDVMIDAFAELARRRPGVRLRFAGPDRGVIDDAGRRWTIEEYAADRLGGDARGRLAWMGQQPAASLSACRKKAGVVVVPSRYDNFPTTVLEAMATGCPLVASRAGGIPEMVEHEVNGLLFESGEPEDLAVQIGRLLDDRGLAIRLGRRALLESERRYSLEVMTSRMETFYREVIDAFDRRQGWARSR